MKTVAQPRRSQMTVPHSQGHGMLVTGPLSQGHGMLVQLEGLQPTQQAEVGGILKVDPRLNSNENN